MMITAWRKSAALAARVAQPPVVEDLQEQVPDARVGLLELVEQHDRERLAADLRRPASGPRAPRRGRRASAAREPGFWYSLMSSRIIRSRRAEQELGQRLGDLGLARAGRADEQQHGLRARRVGQPGLDQRDALDHALDRLGLADHARGEERAAARRRRAARARRAATAAARSARRSSPARRPSSAARRRLRRRVASSSESSAPGSAASPRKWRPSASASRSTTRSVPARRARPARACAPRSSGSTRSDVERVAHRRPRAHAAARRRPGSSSPAMCTASPLQAGQQQVERCRCGCWR